MQFAGVNFQAREADAHAMLEEMDAVPSVVDPDGRIAIDWGSSETFVLDPEGRVRARALGAVTEGWALMTVAALLGEAEDAPWPPGPVDEHGEEAG